MLVATQYMYIPAWPRRDFLYFVRSLHLLDTDKLRHSGLGTLRHDEEGQRQAEIGQRTKAERETERKAERTARAEGDDSGETTTRTWHHVAAVRR